MTQVISEFQQVELENFLQCNILGKKALDKTVPVIYMLVLETKNQVAIIFQGTKPLEYHLYMTNWDQIKVAINKLQDTLEKIELMVLSTCQTATGDHRASLGLAGVAIQAGAETVVASLWNVSDRSTALLMRLFYQNLSKPNLTH